MPYLLTILKIASLVLGFGFIVFFHELGHFLAAQWVGIRCEQFAVGFGHAVFAWRKGLGIRRGTTRPEFEQRVREHLHLAADADTPLTGQQIDRGCKELGLGETEYRWNWIPLGGYVKMVGQDDMDAAARSDDPRSFTQKSVGARALVISAGVIFNVILAAVMFVVLYRTIGLNTPPAIVGSVQTGSPAQLAGLRPGDTILDIDGWNTSNFGELAMVTALCPPASPATVTVRHTDGIIDHLQIQPRKSPDNPRGFLTLGVSPAAELAAVTQKDFDAIKADDPELTEAAHSPQPGERIIRINDVEVADPAQSWLLYQELQKSTGQPVRLTVADARGARRTIDLVPAFGATFGGETTNVAGMVPRVSVRSTVKDSPGASILKKGDLIIAMKVAGKLIEGPGYQQVTANNFEAGDKELPVQYQIIRDGKTEWTRAVSPTYKAGEGHRGVGFGLASESSRPVVNSALPGSPAAAAGVSANSLITQVNGEPVSHWLQVRRKLLDSKKPPVLTCVKLDPQTDKPVAGSESAIKLALSDADLQGLRNIQVASMDGPLLRELIKPRKTSSTPEAIVWGVRDTRNLLLQFYVVLKRTFIDRTVSIDKISGPVGIGRTGWAFVQRGPDWLVWFLAMISANLAVVNFLPIPIMDGGLFVILIAEKLRGKPLTPRTQTALQYVGLAIILSVFLFVTVNDIRGFFM
ncbi:MAG: site-2 protease family protein [Tepidisphaeraceae bacterium]|jgi:regulator of sigma E protease